VNCTFKFELSWDDFPGWFIAKWNEQIQLTDPVCDGVKIELELDYTPMRPGKFDGPWENCYPTEPAEFEIIGKVITVPYCSDGARADAEPEFMTEAIDFAHQWMILPAHEEKLEERILEFCHDAHQDEMAGIIQESQKFYDKIVEEFELEFGKGVTMADYAASDYVAKCTEVPGDL